MTETPLTELDSFEQKENGTLHRANDGNWFHITAIASAVQGLKEELCLCKGSSVPAQALKQLFNGCKNCKAIDKWFVGVVKK